MEEASAEENLHKETGSLFPLCPSIPNSDANTLFPSFPNSDVNNNSTTATQWLNNSSFTTDLSVIDHAVSSHYDTVFQSNELEEDLEEEGGRNTTTTNNNLGRTQYKLVDSYASDESSDKKNKRKKRKRSSGAAASSDCGLSSRKADVKAWARTSEKNYYFDSRGDRDNLAFGSLYRMDIARYKAHRSTSGLGVNHALYHQNQKSGVLDGDNDINALDNKLKSAGRYWSASYIALERHKNFKRLRILAPEKSTTNINSNFIPLSDDQTFSESSDDGPISRATVVEESWEDLVLRKTREFNKLTREYPHNDKFWLDFADFQDQVASRQPQKGARLQTLEKKISILEKAVEVNPDSEELLLTLMTAYQSRDSADVMIGRWEKILMEYSGSLKLWREFLHIVQGEFSRFKISELRKIYANAIRALSATRGKRYRQVHQIAVEHSVDTAIIEKELGLVDIFISLCRLEWQAGYQELATALFQAEIEYCLFCPSLLLSEQSKLRLFEYFWDSNGARVGEDGAVGWSTWLEKEEEQKQKVINEELDEMDEGGWTGWSEPLSKNKDLGGSQGDVDGNTMDVEEFDDDSGLIDVGPEKDTATLLKMLGIEADAKADDEVKDTLTWTRWSKEELLRDSAQWMPLHAKAGVCHGDGIANEEGDENFSRVVLFADISEYLFSLSSQEARLSLIFQFIDFYGGRISQWTSTNSSTWAEKTLSSEALPDLILDNLRKLHNILNKPESIPSSFGLESSLGSSVDTSMRTNMMKFLRNATLLSLTSFPRNHILEEAVLVAEELSNTRMNSLTCMVTPCRALAKSLLKQSRQDVLLCGVYARREAMYGNIDHARKVFDMALSSIEGVPLDSHSNKFLIFFWYAEMELSNSSGSGSESESRALHILYCLGSGAKYIPFKCQPSSLQQLRARQGFKEQMRAVRAMVAHGTIDDQAIALICSAALFEEFTSGWNAAVDVFDQAFSMVLPERRSQSYQMESLFNYYVKMLWKHHQRSKLSEVWDSILQGLQIYPFSPELYSAFVEVGYLHTAPSKMRWIFDNNSQKKPSVIAWIFALSFEISRGSSHHRVHGLFERALTNEKLCNSVILWRWYISYEIDIVCDPSAARRVYFRAIHSCPWSKKLWLDGFVKLNSILTAKELSDLQEVMRDKELNLRTDIYEILLQDEVES